MFTNDKISKYVSDMTINSRLYLSAINMITVSTVVEMPKWPDGKE